MFSGDVRQERPGDRAAVHRVHALAFGQAAEADLVDALRDAGHGIVSLVAALSEEVVGHVLFSPVTIEVSPRELRALGLAPLAVLPELQNRGIGSALVRRGLEECARLGYGAVVVLGHAPYYPRFGFAPASRSALRCEYQVPDETFMAAELVPGALESCAGLVRYRPEFAAV